MIEPLLLKYLCKRCLERKPRDAFGTVTHQLKAGPKTYPQSYCKTCINKASAESRKTRDRRAEGLWTRHKMRWPEFIKMAVAQGYACALCQRGDRKLHVDHDHETGRKRGLLCGPCNRALGILGDTSSKLERAAAYLRGE